MTGANSLMTFGLHLTLSPHSTLQLLGSASWLCSSGSLTGNLSYVVSSVSPETGTSRSGRMSKYLFKLHSAINPMQFLIACFKSN